MLLVEEVCGGAEGPSNLATGVVANESNDDGLERRGLGPFRSYMSGIGPWIEAGRYWTTLKAWC